MLPPLQPFITMVGDPGRTVVRMDRTAGKMNMSGAALGTGEGEKRTRESTEKQQLWRQ